MNNLSENTEITQKNEISVQDFQAAINVAYLAGTVLLLVMTTTGFERLKIEDTKENIKTSINNTVATNSVPAPSEIFTSYTPDSCEDLDDSREELDIIENEIIDNDIQESPTD